MDAEVRDVLVKARAMISDPERHCPDDATDDEGRACAIHAMNLNSPGTGVHRGALDALGDAVKRLYGPYVSIPATNRNHAEIILAFDVAIGDGGLDSPCEDAEHAKAAVEKACAERADACREIARQIAARGDKHDGP